MARGEGAERALRAFGVVLAGGAGRRMGGADKALLPLAGRPLIAHVVARIAPQCAALAINADGDPRRFDDLALPVVPDGVPDRPGPLAGILAALEWCGRERPDLDSVLTVPCDTPFLPTDLVARLAAARAGGSRAAVAARHGRVHPVVGLWSVDLAEALRDALTAGGMRRVDAWCGAVGAVTAAFDADALDPFWNLNTPADLVAAEAHLVWIATDRV